MNNKQLQSEIFKRLLARDRVCYDELDGESIAITFDGYRAYALAKKDICFDLACCKKIDTLHQLFETNDSLQKVKMSGAFFLMGDRMVQRLDAQDFRVWVNKTYIDSCERYDLYAQSRLGPVRVINPVTNKVVAIILPIRVDNEEKYKDAAL